MLKQGSPSVAGAQERSSFAYLARKFRKQVMSTSVNDSVVALSNFLTGLDSISKGALVFDQNLNILGFNTTFEGLNELLSICRFDSFGETIVRFEHPNLLEEILSGKWQKCQEPAPLYSADGSLFNLDVRQYDLGFGKPAEQSSEVYILYISRHGFSADQFVNVAAGRWNLAPHEARFLRELILCGNVRAAAETCGLSYNSGKSYLKSIYSKTLVGNLAQLFRSVYGLTD